MRLKDLTRLVLENSNAFIKQNDIVTVFSVTTSVQALGKQKSFVLQVCCKKNKALQGKMFLCLSPSELTILSFWDALYRQSKRETEANEDST